MGEPASVPATPAAKAAAARLAGVKQPTRLVPDPDAPNDAERAGGTAKSAKAPKADKAAKAKKEPDEGKKKRKVPIKAVAIVLVLLLVGFEVKGKVIKPHYGPGESVPAGSVASLGTITTNLSDGHLAQVSISLQLTAPANEKAVAKDEPEMTATAVTDIGELTYNGLLAPSGRAALRSELLRAFQSQLGTSEGAQQVSAVYLTRFILQ